MINVFKKVLVVTPHCDDESFGMAGTILRMKEIGVQVTCVVCTVGDVEFEHCGVVTKESRLKEFSCASIVTGKQRKIGRAHV